ncbi:MAG: thioredoxin domain-containing protein, partial [Desulfobacterales bacterium]|nr:thioredoxin domain-containing protein [Desulfobacterales bacterium]
KVDREERPDIDKVYMVVTQAMTGRGGWPMTVILTPDKKGFFAATYLPKTSGLGRPGLMELLPKIVDVWKNQREAVNKNADQITDLLTRISGRKPGDAPGNQILVDARIRLAELYDPEFGGFGKAPKFPTPHILTFLLRQYHHTKDSRLLAMVENTLTQMRLGGIYDQVGFGFHRYATDSRWLVPHFEKMLYDQALLAMAYTEAYQATGKKFYARTVREIIAYILRDMTSNEGGFYSAEDADSEGVEGKFYLWTLPQIQKILGKKETETFKRIYTLEANGNFTSREEAQAAGSNILHLKKALPDLAGKLGVPEKQLHRRLEINREKLFKVRNKRVHPFKDDKILTDWNGLMIAALARAGQVLNEPRYTADAVRAADFIMLKLRDVNGRLVKRYRKGTAGLPAHLDDYAFVVWGFLELYEATLKA